MELGFQEKFVKGVDGLGHVNVVTVGDIRLIGHTLDNAEPLLQTLGELVGRGLQRRAVEGVVDVLGSLPLGGVLVEFPHDGKTQCLTFRLGQLFVVEGVDALPKSRIAEGQGGVTAV